MNALLDTHTFLWWNLDDPQLTAKAWEVIANPDNAIYLSAASAWEIALKCAKGRLMLPEAPDTYFAERMTHYRFLPLPITHIHALQVYALPAIHTDPFDRLLVAQAQIEAMPLLSGDADIHQYQVEIIW